MMIECPIQPKNQQQKTFMKTTTFDVQSTHVSSTKIFKNLAQLLMFDSLLTIPLKNELECVLNCMQVLSQLLHHELIFRMLMFSYGMSSHCAN